MRCGECGNEVINQDWRRDYDYCSLRCAKAALPKRTTELADAQREYDNTMRVLDVAPESQRLWAVARALSRAARRRNGAELEIAMYRDGPRHRP
jgi:endogenous inhibitor of DNA gyrase (YacG/DUF329 family)